MVPGTVWPAPCDRRVLGEASMGSMDEAKKMRITVWCISALVAAGFLFFFSGGLGYLLDS